MGRVIKTAIITAVVVGAVVYTGGTAMPFLVGAETTAAANNAISLSARDAFGADNLLKKWIAGGRNIRDTHSRATVFYRKNPIEENKPYAVGSSFLMFPGDTQLGASASEIVNCKCVSFPIIKVD